MVGLSNSKYPFPPFPLPLLPRAMSRSRLGKEVAAKEGAVDEDTIGDPPTVTAISSNEFVKFRYPSIMSLTRSTFSCLSFPYKNDFRAARIRGESSVRRRLARKGKHWLTME